MYTKLPVMMMNKNDYTEISEDHPGAYGKGQESVGTSANLARERRNRNRFWDAGSFFRSWSLMKVVMLAMVVLLLAIIVFQGVEEHSYSEHEWLEEQEEAQVREYKAALSNAETSAKRRSFVHREAGKIPMPSGVNLGSWLSLEDYFFAGPHNAIEVATPGQGAGAKKVAACLPPLHVGSSTGPKWHSETDLFRSLMDPIATKGGSVAHAIRVFAAHRTAFVDLETDLERVASLGITTVRVPMSWCWTDSDPRTTDLSSLTDEELLERFACEDPFFQNGAGSDGDSGSQPKLPMLWPAIPKALVEDLLRACARAGIKASLDVHTLPGGTSIGTFSGVWPNWPRFWTHGGDGVEEDGHPAGTRGFGVGHELFRTLVAWMEDLSVRDPLAFSGLRGISPMNEPAHLAGNFGESDPDNFLPPLPPGLAAGFREGLGGGLPDGSHLRVLYWFHRTITIFRESRLPALGVELQANIIESIFPWLAPDGASELEDGMLKLGAIAEWWCPEGPKGKKNGVTATTTAEERSTWAVLDIHHYHAWSSVCSGTVDGQDSAYACSDADRRGEVLGECTRFAGVYREAIDKQCGAARSRSKPAASSATARLMSAEFSAASHHSVRRACNDLGSLRDSYARQVTAAEAAGVELFYWSYQMPYGGAFRRAWSFRELMYGLGVLDRPDAPLFDCDSGLAYDPDLPP
ncbi:unnamed protein product [Pseudo-nitzschia multistriata]|uniref:Uncharacterized protein n=1 Tax=Pseudo-nitzschia multistriata TaxID=183589 RepID=A0A448ZEA6_9STRA|nr:unnamed protein product [Pseudo-nitzschia multistriata]